jgi:hypothetical protein
MKLFGVYPMFCVGQLAGFAVRRWKHPWKYSWFAAYVLALIVGPLLRLASSFLFGRPSVFRSGRPWLWAVSYAASTAWGAYVGSRTPGTPVPEITTLNLSGRETY